MPRGKHNSHVRGSKHYRWNENLIKTSHGYLKIRVGTGHSLADPNGYAYMQLVVWVSCGNLRPSHGYIIHHKNLDKTDNRINNLEIMSRTEHNRIHNQKKNRDEFGKFQKEKRPNK